MLPLTPTKLGRYEIVDEIGKGAMGVVYLARDPLIGRLVALKTFRIGYSVRDQEMDQFRARFIREAQSAGILSHPNIVTIHDVVEESEEGLAFIAMEYVRGTNLKVLMQGDQPLSLAFVADVIAQVADALDYAHSHRVIHRDVKPANILITADNRVKITDFGIARLDTSNLTQEGQLLGTPNYMAPEQIQGKEVDHRADLFALGVVLYEMLTRHKPFQGENLTVVSHRIVYDHFTPPREFVREMPTGIEPILNRALEKDPARRYQKAKEMVDDLRRVSGAMTAEDLNETQSLATIAPILLPPLLPEASGHVPLPSQTPPAGTPRAAKPPRAPRPPRPPRNGPLVSPRRIALGGGAGALLALVLGAAVLLGLAWSTPGNGRNPQQDSNQASFIAWMRLGHQLMRAGDPAGAAAAYQQAEPLVPKPAAARIRSLRELAQRQADEQGRLQGAAKERAARLMEAQVALESRRWPDAIAAANAVLAVDPQDVIAQQIVATAQGFQAKARERTQANAHAPRRDSELASTSTSPVPAPAEASPAEPVSHEATLRVTFDSELGGAVVRVMVGDQTLLQETVGDRGGIFHRGGSGNLDRSFTVNAGSAVIKVWVTPPGEKSTLHPVSGNFLGGSSRHLAIRLNKAKASTANLF